MVKWPQPGGVEGEEERAFPPDPPPPLLAEKQALLSALLPTSTAFSVFHTVREGPQSLIPAEALSRALMMCFPYVFDFFRAGMCSWSLQRRRSRFAP